MTEKLLQYIWQFQYYNRSELRTEQGDTLQIIEPGTWNTNQGPDFMAAKIRTGETVWAGSVELHIYTSDWYKHLHQTDANYKNVVLHVVWKNDEMVGSERKQNIPILELEPRVSVLLLKRYEELMNNVCFVPCQNNLHRVNDLIWLKWKERLLVERLQRKSRYILQLFEKSNHHWEETFWWIISRNFGIRVNADAFEAIAQTIPVKVLTKHKNQIHELEALLFGQAGLLDQRFSEDYPRLLQKEYRYFKKKYQLKKVFVALKFLRMRPSSFPSVRLAQLAMLIHQSVHLFSQVKEAASLEDVKLLLNVTANDYWHYHYRFEEQSAYFPKNLGEDMLNNILINTISPVLFAYGMYRDEQTYQSKALTFMEAIAHENNRITSGWLKAGVSNLHAYDSQALIELKTQYCDCKRCLECGVGNALLRGDDMSL